MNISKCIKPLDFNGCKCCYKLHLREEAIKSIGKKNYALEDIGDIIKTCEDVGQLKVA